MPTSQRPAGQPKTSFAVLLALPDVPLEPMRIWTAIAQNTAYAMPLPSAPSRSRPLSAPSGPWPSRARKRRQSE